MTTEERLNQKCKALENIINSVKYYYSNEANDYQKSFIETIIGAAIWYLPHGKQYWNEKVSKCALERLSQDEGAKLTKDHVYPRKQSAKKLLSGKINMSGDGEVLKELYKKELGTYTLVTPEENKKLIPFQKNQTKNDWEGTYFDADIQLITEFGDDIRRLLEKKG